MSMRDVIEPLDMLVEQHQDEATEHAVGEQNLADDVITIQPALNWYQQALCGQLRATSGDRTPIAGLSPIQNEWIRRYTRPNITVNLPLSVEQLPSDFSLEHLLSHALEQGWDLTEVGWDRAYELGVAQPFENPASDAPSEYDGWWTNAEAARELHSEIDESRSFEYCKSLLSKRASSGRIKTNGKRGRGCRFLPDAVKALALEVRNRDCDEW